MSQTPSMTAFVPFSMRHVFNDESTGLRCPYLVQALLTEILLRSPSIIQCTTQAWLSLPLRCLSPKICRHKSLTGPRATSKERCIVFRR